MSARPLKVALVHYWITSWRGGERVLEALARRFPEADIYTHVVDPKVLAASPLAQRRIRTTFIRKLPFAVRWYQKYLPLMPLALEQLDLSGYDLVISTESGPAKGLVLPPDVKHVCYCFTPMRYVWDLYHDYLAHAGWFTRLMMRPLIHYLRLWDRLSADRVDHFFADSAFVARRIAKFYRREADVLYPPIEIAEFDRPVSDQGFYLVVGALARYKRADLAVRAANRLGLRLVVIGDGEQMVELRQLAGPTVTLLGRASRETILDHYARCRALLFPGVEDFGIVPLEAMASGKPVLAYARGGALETVVDGVTGLHVREQTEEAFVAAMQVIERGGHSFDTAAIRAHAAKFDMAQFQARLGELLRFRMGLSI